MAANEELNQLSTTDASNTPAGSDVIGATLDNELRSIKANIARSAREEVTATASAAATLAVTVLNKIVPVSGSAGGSTTITLPAAATAGAGFRFTAWKTDNTNNVIIEPDGSETVNGAANYTLATQYEAAQFVTDGTSWIVESTAKRELSTSDLADDSVTNAKLANMAQDRIKGRITAGTGDPEDLTASQVRTMLSVYDQSTSDSRYVNVSGDTMTGDLSFGDSNKAIFGAGSDLQIYHNGTDSIVSDEGAGRLILEGSTQVIIRDSAASGWMLRGVEGGATELYHNNAQRLATTSAGVDVTGRLNATNIIDTAAGFEFGSNNNYLYQSGTDEVTLRVGSRPTYFDFHDLGASTGVRFNSTSTPLYLGAGNNNHVKISSAETVINEDAGTMDFRVESAPNANALFVDGTDSRVGINNGAPTEALDVLGNARLVSEDATSAAEPVLTLYRNSATPADGDYLGQIKFQGESDSGATRVYAKITAKTSDVTNLSEDGLIETSIRKAGTNTIVARQTHDCLKLINGTGLEVAGDATITGSFVTGTSGASTITTRAYIYYDGAGTQYGINMRPATDNTVSIHFQNASGTNVGSISQTASATTYTTTSDYRIKDNVVVLSGAIERVKQLKPKRFNFAATPDVTVDGFLAHEAQAVVPEAITGAKDAVDQDGQPKLQGIDQSKIVPLLTAALQEAVTKIESLETRITALEAN